METMVQRLAFLFLVVTVVTSGASAPFAHVHPPDRDAQSSASLQVHSHSATHGDDDAHWHIQNRESHSAARLDRFGNSHPDVSVALAAVAVERFTTAPDAARALVEHRQSLVRPDQPERSLTVFFHRLPDPPPRVGPAARAPPA